MSLKFRLESVIELVTTTTEYSLIMCRVSKNVYSK